MKKNKLFVLGMLALALTLGLALAGCDNGTTGDERVPITYNGTSGGTTYTLTISPPASRAAAAGDEYELVVTTGSNVKTSIGTVKEANDSAIVLQPEGKDTTFSVSISGTDITGITGTITYDDDTSVAGPSVISGIVGTWVSVSESDGYRYVLVFRPNGTCTFTAIRLSNNQTDVNQSGTYSVSGNEVTTTDILVQPVFTFEGNSFIVTGKTYTRQ